MDTRLDQPEDSREGLLRPGSVFGQYRVEVLLGRGGMGEVYRVRHTVLGAEYAIKLLNKEILGRSDIKDRFRREAKVMANLSHPGIVRVDEYGETGELVWLRMELVGFNIEALEGDSASDAGGRKSKSSVGSSKIGQGASLEDYLRIRGGALTEQEARSMIRQVLESLAYAHGKGVVHRDLKPANVLLEKGTGGELRTRISDFGIVRLVGEEWFQSKIESSVVDSMAKGVHGTILDDPGANEEEMDSGKKFLGTFEYMSPEQKAGDEADERSDLYAVGLIAWRILTGERALGLEQASSINQGLDPVWDEWLMRMVATKKERRYQSAEAALAALPSGYNKKSNRFRPQMVVVSVVVLAGTVVGVYFSGLFNLETGDESHVQVREVEPQNGLDGQEVADLDQSLEPEADAGPAADETTPGVPVDPEIARETETPELNLTFHGSVESSGKPRLAVLPFSTGDHQLSASGFSGDRLGQELSERIEILIAESGGYRVLERSSMNRYFEIGDLSQSGNFQVGRLAQLGADLNIDYILVGIVEGLNIRSSQRESYGVQSTFYEGSLSVSIRVLDTSSNEILWSTRLSEQDSLATRSPNASRDTADLAARMADAVAEKAKIRVLEN